MADKDTLQQERIRRRLAQKTRRGVKVRFHPLEKGKVPEETRFIYEVTPRRDPSRTVEGLLSYHKLGPKNLEVHSMFPSQMVDTSSKDLSHTVLKPAEVREAIGKAFKSFPKARGIVGMRATGMHPGMEQIINNPAFRKTKLGRALGVGMKLAKKVMK